MQRVARMLVPLLAAVVSCAVVGPGRPAEVRTTQAELAPELRPIGPPATCRLPATDAALCDRRDVTTLLEQVRGRLEECRGPTDGKLVVRVRETGGGKLAFDVDPSSSLDIRQRQCALDALTAIQTTENTTLWSGGAGIPPTGFTSLLTIEWGR